MSPEKTERIERVSELAAERFSAAEIAMRMGCTRNAISGLCDRHGITLHGVKGRRLAPRSPRIPRPHIRSAEAKTRRRELALEKTQRQELALRHKIYKPSRILMWAGLT
jgi:hypothetical protein